ncbi:MAG TPA: MFS transporter [Polyangiaceae bacterium]|jgi:DHA2 family multidrug resistance protein-like MFS transporter
MKLRSATPAAGRREWIALAVIALPCVLYAMDLTVLNLALPRVSEDLRPSSAQLLWIVDTYGFFVAGLLVTMGTLGDRIGRRRLLLLGAAAFGAASLLAAFSRSATMLIVARGLLGIAGATLAPSTLSLIRNIFLDPKQRRVAVGIWISSYSFGGAIGPVLGGLMLQHFRWGSVFLLAVPVMLLLLLVGPFLLPEFSDPAAAPLDLPSAALSLLAVLSVIAGIKLCAQDGLGTLPLFAIALGLVLGFSFVRRQHRLEHPLIDLKLFQAPAFGASLAIYLVGTLVAFGSYVFVGQYLQLVLELTPLSAGLWLLPWSGGFIVGSSVAPQIARRVRPGLVMSGGLALAALGFFVLSTVSDTGMPGLISALVLYSLGLAPVFTLGTDLIIGAAPRERAGAAAAISETASELGGALGIAVLGSIGTALYRSSLAATTIAGVPPEARAAAEDTLGGANVVAARLPPAARVLLLDAARAAFASALHVTALICAVVAALTAVFSWVALRRLGLAAAGAESGGEESDSATSLPAA